MPTGPKGQKRPADVIGNSVKVMRIATGGADEKYEASLQNDEAASAMAAGVSDRLWSMDDVAALIEAAAPVPAKRGPYKKREAV